MKQLLTALVIASLVIIGAYVKVPYTIPTIERAAPPRLTIQPKRRPR